MSPETKSSTVFILIDDDDVNNMISRLTIKTTWPDVEVVTFSNPVMALNFFQNDLNVKNSESTEIIVLLNLNMPLMSGWEFLEKFGGLKDELKSAITIYILTSSLDHRDLEKSQLNKYIREFISKPLTAEMVLKMRTRTDPSKQ